ncbi:MAG: hypothetical protein R3B65_02130 [Candidatus Paceibacterota bacterium]
MKEGAPKASERILERIPVADVESVVTAKGSTYSYLPNGTTQRMKKVEGKEYAPQSALVYVPDYEWVKKNFHPDKLERMFGDNPGTYVETLVGYVQNEDKKCYLVDQEGRKLETNQELRDVTGPIFLTFGDEQNTDFMIPVTVDPTIGYITYDSRKYKDEKTGEYKRERHLGNPVIKIIVKKKQN